MAILWPVKTIFEKWAAMVHVDALICLGMLRSVPICSDVCRFCSHPFSEEISTSYGNSVCAVQMDAAVLAERLLEVTQ